MTIQKTKHNEILIRFSSDVDLESVQDFLDYVRYRELLSKSNVKQSTVDRLSKSVNRRWWVKNAKRFTR
jgi:hypothetical protein